MRCLYRRAVDSGYLSQAENPAAKVAKPRRQASTQRALPDARLAEINQVAATTGNGPALDTLLLRLHTETTCRRALADVQVLLIEAPIVADVHGDAPLPRARAAAQDQTMPPRSPDPHRQVRWRP